MPTPVTSRYPMSDLPALAQIMSSGVALMGALVAGLSVYFNYKGRHNQFRQVVYNRQMDAYFDIVESMAALFTAAQNILACSSPWLKGQDARTRFRTALREEHERFTGTVNRSLIVLPSKVKAAVDGFNETLLAIGHPAGGPPAAPARRPRDPAQAPAPASQPAHHSNRPHPPPQPH